MNSDKLASDRQSSNRRIGLWVFAGMLAFAAVATVSMLSMTSFRRGVDKLQPAPPPFWRTVLTDVAIFLLFGSAGVLWAYSRKSRDPNLLSD